MTNECVTLFVVARSPRCLLFGELRRELKYVCIFVKDLSFISARYNIVERL